MKACLVTSEDVTRNRDDFFFDRTFDIQNVDEIQTG
jgi:hypothetical protein